jgi:hypothetical protein
MILKGFVVAGCTYTFAVVTPGHVRNAVLVAGQSLKAFARVRVPQPSSLVSTCLAPAPVAEKTYIEFSSTMSCQMKTCPRVCNSHTHRHALNTKQVTSQKRHKRVTGRCQQRATRGELDTRHRFGVTFEYRPCLVQRRCRCGHSQDEWFCLCCRAFPRLPSDSFRIMAN